jgi:hypothetical protein
MSILSLSSLPILIIIGAKVLGKMAKQWASQMNSWMFSEFEFLMWSVGIDAVFGLSEGLLCNLMMMSDKFEKLKGICNV